MIKSIALCLSFVACGYEQPDYRVAGVSVWFDGEQTASREDFARVLGLAFGHWAEATGGEARHVFERHAGLHVRFVGERLDCSVNYGPGATCDAQSTFDTSRVLLLSGCLADTGLLHELLHLVWWRKTGDPDHEHAVASRWWFADVDGVALLRPLLDGCQ